MHNLESVQENETHKIHWDLDIQTNHLISARRPDQVIVNKKKKNLTDSDFAIPANHRVKIKGGEKRDKYQDLARELKMRWNMKVTVIPIVSSALGTIPKGLLKGLEDLKKEDKRKVSKLQHY